MIAQKLTLGKQERLLKTRDFEQASREGFLFRKPLVCLIVLKKAKGPARLGIKATRKQFPRAVDRNQIKRWTREFFRKRKHLLRFPCDLVVLARKAKIFSNSRAGRLAGQQQQFMMALEQIFEEAGLLTRAKT